MPIASWKAIEAALLGVVIALIPVQPLAAASSQKAS
jgi:hypothetical protein